MRFMELLFIVACMGFVVAVSGYLLASRECLQLGWPNAKVDITLTQYCIKRVDQTDVVRPLKALRAK